MLASDDRRYWCKAVTNPQGSRVLVTEQIVSRLGRLIGAAVCESALVFVPPELASWQYRDSTPIGSGWVHGSAAVDDVYETRALGHRSSDDNARRQASFFALYDWLAGQDAQWLVRPADDLMYFSHDHGHYFPGGPRWSAELLRANVTTPYSLSADVNGLDPDTLIDLAQQLQQIRRSTIEYEIADMPLEWSTTDAELEMVVEFADARRIPVAHRLRQLASGQRGGQG